MSSPRLEHRIEFIPVTKNMKVYAKNLAKMLNDLPTEGWEIVQVIHDLRKGSLIVAARTILVGVDMTPGKDISVVDVPGLGKMVSIGPASTPVDFESILKQLTGELKGGSDPLSDPIAKEFFDKVLLDVRHLPVQVAHESPKLVESAKRHMPQSPDQLKHVTDCLSAWLKGHKCNLGLQCPSYRFVNVMHDTLAEKVRLNVS